MKHLLLIFLFFPMLSYSQNVNQNVIATSGSFDENGKVSLSWTIGETVTASHENTENILNQGFHQGALKIKTLIDKKEIPQLKDVYPNPVKTALHIRVKKKGLKYQVIDLKGQVLKAGVIENYEKTIDFSSNPQGPYILKLNQKETHKIIKQ